MYTGFTGEFRRRSREYFGYRCVFCGCDTIGYDRLQPVHHVHYNADHVMDELDNLSYVVPLCGSCHSRTKLDRKFWIELFTWFIEVKCGGRYLMPRDKDVVPITFIPLTEELRGLDAFADRGRVIVIPQRVKVDVYLRFAAEDGARDVVHYIDRRTADRMIMDKTLDLYPIGGCAFCPGCRFFEKRPETRVRKITSKLT